MDERCRYPLQCDCKLCSDFRRYKPKPRGTVRLGGTEVTSKDPNSWIQASAETLAETLLSKNHDYAPEGEFSNFEQAAKLATVSPLEAILVQIGIKVTRIDTLTGSYQTPENEPLKDSFLDLAGYALIAHAYLSATEPRHVGTFVGSLPDSKPVGTIDSDPHWLVRDDV